MEFNKKCIFILTGASKGIGKTMAVECSKRLGSNSLVVLLARSQTGLDKTRQEILSQRNDITVKVYSRDLGTATSKDYKTVLDDALTGVSVTDFEQALIIHNVGSVGDVSKKAKELGDVETWEKYLHLNVSGVCALNVEFMNRCKDIQKIVVNITSLCGIKPFASMAEYCSGKAAREMYFRVLAEEEKDTVVLNYSPGPVDTDMTVYVQKESVDEGLRDSFRDSREKKTILTTELTTAKFLSVLEERKFKSGQHVDYYD